MPFGTFIQDFIICGSPDIHLLGDFCGAQTFDAQRQNAAAVYSGLAAESNAFCPSLQSPSSFVRSSIRSRSALATVDSMLTTHLPNRAFGADSVVKEPDCHPVFIELLNQLNHVCSIAAQTI